MREKMSRREFLNGLPAVSYFAFRPREVLQLLSSAKQPASSVEAPDFPDLIDVVIQELKKDRYVDSSFLISAYLEKLDVPSAVNNEGVNFQFVPGKKLPKSNTHAQTTWWQAEDYFEDWRFTSFPKQMSAVEKGDVIYFESDSNQYGTNKFALAAISLSAENFLSVAESGQAQVFTQQELVTKIHGNVTRAMQVDAWGFAAEYTQQKFEERRDPEVTEDFSGVAAEGDFFDSYPPLTAAKLQGVFNQVNGFYARLTPFQPVLYVSYEDRVGVVLEADSNGKLQIHTQFPVGLRLPPLEKATDLGVYTIHQQNGEVSYVSTEAAAKPDQHKVESKQMPKYEQADLVFVQQATVDFDGLLLDLPSHNLANLANYQLLIAPFTNARISRRQVSAQSYYQHQLEMLEKKGREVKPIQYDSVQNLESVRESHQLVILLYGMHNSWGGIAIKPNGHKTQSVEEFIWNVEQVMTKRQAALGGNLGKQADLIAFSPNGLNLDTYDCAIRLMEKGYLISLNMKPAYENMDTFLTRLDEVFGSQSKLFPQQFLQKYPIGISFDPENWGLHRGRKVSGEELAQIRQKYEQVMIEHAHELANLPPMIIYNMGIGSDGFLVEVDGLDPQKYVLVNAGIAGVGDDDLYKKQQALDTSYKTFPEAARLRPDGKSEGTFGVMFYDEPHLKNFPTLHENLTISEQRQLLQTNKQLLTYVASQ